jgi:1-deoxy-D-xylulose-5-phosphate reductoisomerase
MDRFPCLRLAYQALRAGGSAPVHLNAANEVAVARFLEGRLAFQRIPQLVEEVLQSLPAEPLRDLASVMAADRRGRDAAEQRLAVLTH